MRFARAIFAMILGVDSVSALEGGASIPSSSLEDMLLEKAVRLEEFDSRILGNDDKEADDDGDNDGDNDDYFNNRSYNFQGYSLKYATCQKVQRYSVEAVQRGEYSSMITDDIVVLRLCPKNQCSSKTQWGCTSGYGEYAIDLSEYISIVMNYLDHKQGNFCGFCKACAAYGYYNAQQDDDNDYYQDDTDDQYYNQGTDDNTDDNNIKGFDTNTCYHYSSRCSNVYDACNNDGGIDYLSYKNYNGCQKIADDGGNYFWLTPQCNSEEQKISMGIFYDEYCSQSASDDVDVEEFTGISFDDVMQSTENIDCFSCARSTYPPYYNANNFMCNNLYKYSGKCNAYLEYDIGSSSGSQNYYTGDSVVENNEEDETQCAFIESIRYGTYDDFGQIYVSNTQQNSRDPVVTTGQKVSLVFISLICGGLAMFSCYLHHEITNLLLKSLSSGLVTQKKSYRKKKKVVKKKRAIRKKYSTDSEESGEWA